MDTQGTGKPCPHVPFPALSELCDHGDSSLLSEPLLTSPLNAGCGMQETVVLL